MDNLSDKELKLRFTGIPVEIIEIIKSYFPHVIVGTDEHNYCDVLEKLVVTLLGNDYEYLYKVYDCNDYTNIPEDARYIKNVSHEHLLSRFKHLYYIEGKKRTEKYESFFDNPIPSTVKVIVLQEDFLEYLEDGWIPPKALIDIPEGIEIFETSSSWYTKKFPKSLKVLIIGEFFLQKFEPGDLHEDLEELVFKGLYDYKFVKGVLPQSLKKIVFMTPHNFPSHFDIYPKGLEVTQLIKGEYVTKKLNK